CKFWICSSTRSRRAPTSINNVPLLCCNSAAFRSRSRHSSGIWISRQGPRIATGLRNRCATSHSGSPPATESGCGQSHESGAGNPSENTFRCHCRRDCCGGGVTADGLHPGGAGGAESHLGGVSESQSDLS